MGSKLYISLFVVAISVFISISEVHSGIVTNQSESVSVSSSVTSNKSKLPEGHAKKPTRVGKVLYTAPYSNVRVTKHEGKLLPSGVSPKFRSITGPVLVKQDATTTNEPTTSTTTTTTTTTTTSTTTPDPIVIDVVTIDEIEGSSESTTASPNTNA